MSPFLALSPLLSSSSTPPTTGPSYGQHLQPSLFSPGDHVPMSRVNQACTPCRTRKVKCSGSVNNGRCTRCELAGKDDCVFEAVPFEIKVATRERKAKRRANVAKSMSSPHMCSHSSSPTHSSTLSIRRRRDRADVPLPMSPRLQLYDNTFTFSSPTSYANLNHRRRRGALCSPTVFQDEYMHSSVPNTGLVYPIYESPYYSIIDSAWTSDARSSTYPTPTSERMYGLGLRAGRDAYPIETTGLTATPSHGQSTATAAATSDGRYYSQSMSVDAHVPDGYFSIPIGHSRRSRVPNEYGNRLMAPAGSPALSHHLLPALSLEDPSGGSETPGPPLTPQSEDRAVHRVSNGRVKAWVDSGLYRDSIAVEEGDQVEWSNAWCM